MDDEFDIESVEVEQQDNPCELIPRESFLNSIRNDNDPIGDLKWVFHALGAKDLKPEDAPSPGAWNLLNELQRDSLMLKQFYTVVYPKLLPSRAQIDRGEDRAEDGRKLFGIIEGLLREPADDAPILSDTERRARELAVSRAGS